MPTNHVPQVPHLHSSWVSPEVMIPPPPGQPIPISHQNWNPFLCHLFLSVKWCHVPQTQHSGFWGLSFARWRHGDVAKRLDLRKEPEQLVHHRPHSAQPPSFKSANSLLQEFHSIAWQQAGLQTLHVLQHAAARYCFPLAALQTMSHAHRFSITGLVRRGSGRGTEREQGLTRMLSPHTGVWLQFSTATADTALGLSSMFRHASPFISKAGRPSPGNS